MKSLLLGIAAFGELVTGLALMVFPPTVVNLLFGAEIGGVGIVISRFAGIALIGLGVAGWPGGAGGRGHCGLLTYSALATFYLARLGVAGEWVGKLLWPAVAVHALFTVLLGLTWRKARRNP